MVEHQLPKLAIRVRFPPGAPNLMKNKIEDRRVSDIQREEDIEKINKCLETGDQEEACHLYSELLSRYAEEPKILIETTLTKRVYDAFASVFTTGEAPKEMPDFFAEEIDYLNDLKTIKIRLEESLEPKEIPEA